MTPVIHIDSLEPQQRMSLWLPLQLSLHPEAISLFPDSYSFQPPQPPPSPPPPPSFRPLASVCGVEPHLEPMVSTVHDEDEELVACDELALHAPKETVDCPVVNT